MDMRQSFAAVRDALRTLNAGIKAEASTGPAAQQQPRSAAAAAGGPIAANQGSGGAGAGIASRRAADPLSQLMSELEQLRHEVRGSQKHSQVLQSVVEDLAGQVMRGGGGGLSSSSSPGRQGLLRPGSPHVASGDGRPPFVVPTSPVYTERVKRIAELQSDIEYLRRSLGSASASSLPTSAAGTPRKARSRSSSGCRSGCACRKCRELEAVYLRPKSPLERDTISSASKRNPPVVPRPPVVVDRDPLAAALERTVRRRERLQRLYSELQSLDRV